ncbi:YjbH domain-containing protein [Salipiger manganoxidans]|uniref:YjbH domain-containing protein n=1 Tax=Salipiger marinus TaxID=555512 RepID=UPI001E525A91|nr:YjbH domain-containing protein [Salipiger manganoxidans]MCD1620893.1 YjbH domain-containing protein [Salipiger manganoxidans]
MTRKRFSRRICGAVSLAATLGTAGPATPQDGVWTRPTLNYMGVPGILDMPTAHPMHDGDISATVGRFERTQRNVLHFQITPRLSGVFRYTYLGGYRARSTDSEENYYDRSFDLRYQITEETASLPAIAVGLQDFGGTGIYAGEYLVASKTFGRLRATTGLGWGRLGSQGGFDNPLGILGDGFKTRPAQTGGIGQTGQVDTDHWFRGDAAVFGGLQYQATDRLVLSAEYSSDAYDAESERMDFEHNSPVNVGLTYRFASGVDLNAAYLYGSTFALGVSYTYNPNSSVRKPSGEEAAPTPVYLRPAGSAADLGWTAQSDVAIVLRDSVAAQLDGLGLELESMSVSPDRTEIRFRNPTYPYPAQALGRVARELSRIMPASVETFDLVLVTANGLPASRITIRRSDLEDLEFAPDGSWQSYARAQITDTEASPTRPDLRGPATPSFTWGLGPYLESSYFDPREPIRINAGLSLRARYEPSPGWVLGGQIRHKLTGNIGDSFRSDSVLPRVRSDAAIYAEEAETALTSLTAARYFRPGEDLYGRVTVGYLEPMFAGLSGEVLWKPVGSRLAFGAELNYAKQRDYDQQFGLRDYDTVTGHVSAYYEGEGGFLYQVDAGRYLAEDWGTTLSVDREFNNGVRLGAFATFTDVSFDDFGEGSFDKGIRVTVPLSLISGRPSKEAISRTIRPVLRDGGARLAVDGRLYEGIRDYHQESLENSWGRFWR